MMPLLREFADVQFVRGMSETNTRVYLVQVSGQRGTFLVERPAKGSLCL